MNGLTSNLPTALQSQLKNGVQVYFEDYAIPGVEYTGNGFSKYQSAGCGGECEDLSQVNYSMTVSSGRNLVSRYDDRRYMTTDLSNVTELKYLLECDE